MIDVQVKTIEVSSDWKVNQLIKDKLKEGYTLHDTKTLALANSGGHAMVMFIFKKEESGEK